MCSIVKKRTTYCHKFIYLKRMIRIILRFKVTVKNNVRVILVMESEEKSICYNYRCL